MSMEISRQAITFVSYFNPDELKDVRIYLDATDCHHELKELLLRKGNLTPLEITILDAIKRKDENIRIQIMARIEQILTGTRAA